VTIARAGSRGEDGEPVHQQPPSVGSPADPPPKRSDSGPARPASGASTASIAARRCLCVFETLRRITAWPPPRASIPQLRKPHSIRAETFTGGHGERSKPRRAPGPAGGSSTHQFARSVLPRGSSHLLQREAAQLQRAEGPHRQRRERAEEPVPVPTEAATAPRNGNTPPSQRRPATALPQQAAHVTITGRPPPLGARAVIMPVSAQARR